jgi:tetratricopeptide (TPR) repeat protein
LLLGITNRPAEASDSVSDLRVTVLQSVLIIATNWLLVLMLSGAPTLIWGQCKPIPAPATSQVSASRTEDCLRRTISLNVLDANSRPGWDLQPADLQVEIGHKAARIVSLSLDKLPRRIVLMVDSSGSMGTSRRNSGWGVTLPVATFAVDVVPSSASVAFVTFADKAVRESKGFENREEVRKEVLALAKQHPSGHTALFDSMDQVLNVFGEPQFGDAIYLVTDGEDNRSTTLRSRLRENLISRGVRVFVFFVPQEGSVFEDDKREIRSLIEGLAEATGGDFVQIPRHRMRVDEQPVLAKIASQIANQVETVYRLGLNLGEEPQKEDRINVRFVDQRRRRTLTIAYPRQLPPCIRAAATPEFFDEPQFTVAGVTDASTPGGHGSDVVVRTKEALAKDTASLTSDAASSQPMALSNADSEKALRAALEKEPNRADLHHSLADIEEKLDDPLVAVKEYQTAAKLNPSEPNLFDWGAELLLHRALEPASEVFTRGSSLFPGSVRMLLGLGVALYDRGAYDQAARSLCQASDLNPADSTPYLFMGKIQAVETTQPEGMGQRLERFARLQPESALANYYYAVSVWQQRKGPEDTENSTRVQSLLEKAVHLDPKLGTAYLQLGILYAERRDWRQAVLSYQQATAADPELEEAHYRLAQAYRQTGEKLKAEQELQLHAQIKKETSEKAERERLEIREFVYTLRDQSSVTPQQPKP